MSAQEQLMRLAGDGGARPALQALATSAHWAADELASNWSRATAIAVVSDLDRALRAVAGLRERVAPLVRAAGLRDEVRAELTGAVAEGDALAAVVSRLATERRQLESARQLVERRHAEATELTRAVEELRRVRGEVDRLPELRHLHDELAELVRPTVGDVRQLEADIADRAEAVLDAAADVLAHLPTSLAATLEEIRERAARVSDTQDQLAERQAEATRLAAEAADLARRVAEADDRILAQTRRLAELRDSLAWRTRRASELVGAASGLGDRAGRLELALGELAERLAGLEGEAGALRAAAQRRADEHVPVHLSDGVRPVDDRGVS